MVRRRTGWVSLDNRNSQNYLRQPPITHAHQIRTPTLILSNTRDPRVNVTQSSKLFYALRDNDVPVEFIAYPIDGHFPADPVHQRDVLDRWIAWVEKHFEQKEKRRTLMPNGYTWQTLARPRSLDRGFRRGIHRRFERVNCLREAFDCRHAR